MSRCAVRYEINPGVAGACSSDPGSVDTLVSPQLEQGAAKGVAADPCQVGRTRAGPRRRYHRIAGVPAKTLQVLGLARQSLVELHHGFTQRCDIEYLLVHLTSRRSVSSQSLRRFRSERFKVASWSAAVLVYGEHRRRQVGPRSRKIRKLDSVIVAWNKCPAFANQKIQVYAFIGL